DIGKVADIQRMFQTIKSQFGGLDIFVSNARATLATGFYAEPIEIPLEAWQATFDTQATEFLVAVRAAVPMMGKNGRIIAITSALTRRASSPASCCTLMAALPRWSRSSRWPSKASSSDRGVALIMLGAKDQRREMCRSVMAPEHARSCTCIPRFRSSP